MFGAEHGLRRLGWLGTHEVVAADGDFVQLHVFGQSPQSRCRRERRRDRVVGGNDYGDRRGQFHHRWAFQGVGEIAVRGQAVVPVRGSDMLSALRVQLTKLGVAAVRAQVGDYLSAALPSQLVMLARRSAASPSNCAARNTR